MKKHGQTHQEHGLPITFIKPKIGPPQTKEKWNDIGFIFSGISDETKGKRNQNQQP